MHLIGELDSTMPHQVVDQKHNAPHDQNDYTQIQGYRFLEIQMARSQE